MSVTNSAAAEHGGFDMESVVTQAVKSYAAEEQRRQAVSDNTVSKAEAERMANERAAAAIKADRARVSSILNSEEAKGREEMARKLAFDSDMAAEAAVDLLKTAPKAEAAKADAMASALDKRMAQGGGAAAVRPDAPEAGGKKSFAQLCGETATKKKG